MHRTSFGTGCSDQFRRGRTSDVDPREDGPGRSERSSRADSGARSTERLAPPALRMACRGSCCHCARDVRLASLQQDRRDFEAVDSSIASSSHLAVSRTSITASEVAVSSRGEWASLCWNSLPRPRRNCGSSQLRRLMEDPAGSCRSCCCRPGKSCPNEIQTRAGRPSARLDCPLELPRIRSNGCNAASRFRNVVNCRRGP